MRFCMMVLMSLLMQPTGLTQAAEDRPNVILMMVDDFGYECVTANGGESYQTPRIDHLAATGIRFEHCHVQPLCTPTRVQLMTGKYNIRNYLRFGTLPRQETTFGHVFQRAGYQTAVCGKWQLGHEADSPQHFGFAESCLWQHTRRPPRYANPGLEYNGKAQDFDDGQYGPTLVNDFALDFITRNRTQPFFLYYPLILTHSPFQPTPDSPQWDPKLKSEREQQDNKYFADMTAYTDRMVGRIVDRLEELQLRDNTLLIFIGDNGTLGTIISRFQGRDFRGGKGQTSHRGTHVPCVVSWPAVIPPGTVCRDLISSADFLPTICQAAGIDVPSDVDGISFLPQLRGQTGTPRDWLYTWYSPRQRPDLTVREYAFDHNYKLYRTGEFFDLSLDADEQNAIVLSQLTGPARQAAEKLQSVLDQFQDARPAELDEKFRAATSADPPPPRKKRKQKQR